jgi:hypothetical protein
MGTASLAAPNSPKSRGAEMGIDFSVLGIGSNINAAVNAVLKIKEPRKTWGFLCDILWKTSRAEMTERVAKHRLAETRAYTGEELRILIQSENGLEFLNALMAEAKPKWWADIQEVIVLCKARALQHSARQQVLSLDLEEMDVPTRRKTKRFFDADRNLTATRAKKETAVGLLHQEHHRAVAGAVAHPQTKAKPAPRAYAGRGR